MRLKERFFKKVRITETCWLWMGAKFDSGYGELYYEGRNRQAHRISYLLFKGEIPEGLNILHVCDVPLCVNPDHLFLGTHADNNLDKKLKGRAARQKGEDHGRAKLSEQQVCEIRRLHQLGEITQKELAHIFEVDPSLVSLIVRRRLWTHLMEE